MEGVYENDVQERENSAERVAMATVTVRGQSVQQSKPDLLNIESLSSP